jgi:hypothetical protein
MSTDDTFTPPKKKPNVLWWIGGGIALLVFIFFLQLFGPNPPIVISPQTTHITSPLGADGLPDYEQYVLKEMREGVTPENNAAALIWTALWPGELDAKDYAAVAAELGLVSVPDETRSLAYLYGQANRQAMLAWLREQGVVPSAAAAAEELGYNPGQDDEEIDGLLSRAMSRPWTSGQIPPLAKWATANKQPLEMLVEASQRPRCYFPSPSLLDSNRLGLIAMLLPGVQSSREAGRALVARAMWHAGENRPEQAWRDLLAAQRIGRLVAQGPTLVEGLVGMAIAGIADSGTRALLDQGKLTPAQARQVQSDLQSLPQFAFMADSLDSMERLCFLDVITHFQGTKNTEMFDWMGVDESLSYIDVFSVDWNVVLRQGNEFYDRYATAARLPDRAARAQTLQRIDDDLRQLQADIQEPATLVAGAISPGRRSEIVAGILVNLFLPAVRAAMEAEDRANSQLELLRLAAALAVYRAEHRTYPEKLDDLVPGILPKLPVDLYNSQPHVYKRTDDGYLLYSKGENGVDDGGSNQRYRVLIGQSIDDFDPTRAPAMQARIPNGADDFAIRLPTPKWEPPKPSQ